MSQSGFTTTLYLCGSVEKANEGMYRGSPRRHFMFLAWSYLYFAALWFKENVLLRCMRVFIHDTLPQVWWGGGFHLQAQFTAYLW